MKNYTIICVDLDIKFDNNYESELNRREYYLQELEVK